MNYFDATPKKVKSTKQLKEFINSGLVNGVFVSNINGGYTGIKRSELNDYFPNGMVVEYFRANFSGMQSNGDLFVTRFI
jgi:hypothetical protein